MRRGAVKIGKVRVFTFSLLWGLEVSEGIILGAKKSGLYMHTLVSTEGISFALKCILESSNGCRLKDTAGISWGFGGTRFSGKCKIVLCSC